MEVPTQPPESDKAPGETNLEGPSWRSWRNEEGGEEQKVSKQRELPMRRHRVSEKTLGLSQGTATF